ncbi:cation transport protein-domain-containing protein [Hygrophoropsis aurantiaca]|uniref:Cation transport protein-domain-containing protein n=1 Tax=Hygrophoropsis aurantiaca TaxID=72124 RepID=A0ACB8A8G9_9AGAM|nr:cation transport protein-domain-containing protein [Hygrophoropsis aurantiaca]
MLMRLSRALYLFVTEPPGNEPGGGLWRRVRKHLNFFRVHILFFCFTPLIFSGILYASNGRYPVSYIDALFNSVSAITVCGLATVNLSMLTPWQQALLFIQMCMGSPVVVSWVMVYIRRLYFAKKFDHIIKAESARRAALKIERELSRQSAASASSAQKPWSKRVSTMLRRRTGLSIVVEDTKSDEDRDSPKEKEGGRKLRTDMIRRMDAPPKLVNPSGWISEGRTVADGVVDQPKPISPRQLAFADSVTRSPERMPVDLLPEYGDDGQAETQDYPPPDGVSRPLHPRRLSDPGIPGKQVSSGPLHKSSTLHSTVHSAQPPPARGRGSAGMPRTTTIEFAPNIDRHHPIPLSPVTSRGRREHAQSAGSESESEYSYHARSRSRPRRRSSAAPPHVNIPMDQHPTTHTYRSSRRASQSYPTQPYEPPDFQPAQKLSGFGGFPMPHELLASLFGKLFPRVKTRLQRTVTIPATTTIAGGGRVPTLPGRMDSVVDGGSVTAGDGTKSVPYISFDAIVGRNSVFHLLTNEQMEELGGVEYRALNALLWLVAVYHFGVQLISFVVIAPYMSLPKWQNDFVPPQLFKTVAPPWFALFQVVSAYTNTGTSLVDQSMVPFQTAYPTILFMIWCILAGNTAFPVFLRLMIWIISKLVPGNSRIHETLHFLLDHPRRCFIYLFPSHQTWFLVTILIVLNSTDWFCFMVLDIGNPLIQSIPIGTRLFAGLLQAVAVRAAGFGIVPLAALSPAVKVMYAIMMYISVYPIALSVRSTNVYEEQSLGVFREDYDYEHEERSFIPTGTRMSVWSRYMGMHARRQLAFDMWWLCLAVFLVCIIERGALDDTANLSWFNIFSIIFELVSAYGTVGLSLGIPTENYSFSGAFHPLSKLIVCIVMLRGRHRGLPVAIDRAVMLPAEFKKQDDSASRLAEDRQSTVRSGRFSHAASVHDDDDTESDVYPAENEHEDHILEKRRRTARRTSSQDILVDSARHPALSQRDLMTAE